MSTPNTKLVRKISSYFKKRCNIVDDASQPLLHDEQEPHTSVAVAVEVEATGGPAVQQPVPVVRSSITITPAAKSAAAVLTPEQPSTPSTQADSTAPLQAINNNDPGLSDNLYTSSCQRIKMILDKYPVKVSKSGKRRGFSVDWFAQYDWIEYSVHYDTAFCFACRYFDVAARNASSSDINQCQEELPTDAPSFQAVPDDANHECWCRALILSTQAAQELSTQYDDR